MKIPTDLAGQQVKFLYTPPGWFEAAKEVEGLVEVIAPDGSALVLKPKGSLRNMMVESHEIEPNSLHVLAEKIKQLSAKKVTGVDLRNIRQHLLDRHGWTLLIINETSDQEALRAHSGMTHNLLGHFHEGV